MISAVATSISTTWTQFEIGHCLMINRACARRAFDVTLFLILVLTSSFGQVLFKARQERARPNSNAAGPPGTPAPPDVSSDSAQEGTPAIPGVEQQARRNIGAFFDKLREIGRAHV